MITQTERLKDILNNQINYAVDEKTIEIAKEMLLKNYPVSDISEITGLSEEAVRELQHHALQS